MNARLEDRISRPDRLIQALAGVAAALSLTLVGWLIAVEVTDTGVRHLPSVHVDNQTHLTLQVQVVGQQVNQQTLDRTALARQGWTVHIPATATADLERAGYQ